MKYHTAVNMPKLQLLQQYTQLNPTKYSVKEDALKYILIIITYNPKSVKANLGNQKSGWLLLCWLIITGKEQNGA